MTDLLRPARSSLWGSVATLLATASTLVCCALPALLVALGAGAALATFISIFPQLVWLSEQKAALFTLSGAALLGAGWIQWRNRYAPCPLELAQRMACMRLRTSSRRVYFVSLAIYLIGGWFAFVQPLLG